MSLPFWAPRLDCAIALDIRPLSREPSIPPAKPAVPATPAIAAPPSTARRPLSGLLLLLLSLVIAVLHFGWRARQARRLHESAPREATLVVIGIATGCGTGCRIASR